MSAQAIQLTRPASYYFNLISGSQEALSEIIEGLIQHPRCQRLWMKAHDCFASQGVDKQHNIISRAFLSLPYDREIAGMFVNSCHMMAIAAQEAGNDPSEFFEDAERGYYHLITIEGAEPRLFEELKNIYAAWGESELEQQCTIALSIVSKSQSEYQALPADELEKVTNAMRTLSDRKNSFGITTTLARISSRCSAMPALDMLITPACDGN